MAENIEMEFEVTRIEIDKSARVTLKAEGYYSGSIHLEIPAVPAKKLEIGSRFILREVQHG